MSGPTPPSPTLSSAPAGEVRHPEAVRWSADGRTVDLLDQTLLPEQETRLLLGSAAEVAEAIRAMRVRGAPAIGVAAALGLALEASSLSKLESDAFHRQLAAARRLLGAARPTAVNLSWALERLRRLEEGLRGEPPGVVACKLYGEATAILEEDRAMCRSIGEHGQALLAGDDVRVMTHCNAGALATSGMGTALAPVYVAAERGRSPSVWVRETRPVLQGSRLTAWELERAGIEATVVVDSAAGEVMRRGLVDVVIVGADRIAANGDVANKIGTYGLAVLARFHGVPFYVAAPSSTFDVDCADGAGIPIEERDGRAIGRGVGKVWAPAFDVTPFELVTGFVTDRGVFRGAEIREASGGRRAAGTGARVGGDE